MGHPSRHPLPSAHPPRRVGAARTPRRGAASFPGGAARRPPSLVARRPPSPARRTARWPLPLGIVSFLLTASSSFSNRLPAENLPAIALPLSRFYVWLAVFKWQLMEQPAESHGGTTGHATWTTAQTALMLSNLANVVASGAKTSKGFKKVHFNACARAINERFKTMRTGEQLKNHLKTWQKKFAKINKLRKLSASGWDEDNFIITLDDEHYNNHVQDHKSDAEFLNKPLEHYAEMQTIFGNTMATGNFAKDSSAPLGTANNDNEAEEVTRHDFCKAPSNTPENNGATSSASKTKKAKIAENEDEGLISAFKSAGESLSSAIKMVANPNEVPEGLFETLTDLPGFEPQHIYVLSISGG